MGMGMLHENQACVQETRRIAKPYLAIVKLAQRLDLLHLVLIRPQIPKSTHDYIVLVYDSENWEFWREFINCGVDKTATKETPVFLSSSQLSISPPWSP